LRYATVALIHAAILAAVSPALFAQWLDYPTPGVPRTPDDKPNLSAPAPKAADGKPDLSGMWGWETARPCPREVVGTTKSVQIPGRIAILTERNMAYRQIFTDGRPLPVDPNPTWKGYSTGKWDGDTLVVQTIGFRDDLWLDSDGNPLTSAAKVTEKFRRSNYGMLEIEITVDDPTAYTAPRTVKLTQPLMVE